MSFIDIPLADAKEPESLPEGAYDCVIADAKPHISKTSGKPSIQCIVKVEGEPNAAVVFHYLSIPSPEDDADQVNTRLVMMKKFLEMFGVPFEGNGFNSDDLLGATARVFLGVDMGDDGVVRNKVTFKKV